MTQTQEPKACDDCGGSGMRVVKYPGCDDECGCTDVVICETCNGTGEQKDSPNE